MTVARQNSGELYIKRTEGAIPVFLGRPKQNLLKRTISKLRKEVNKV